MAAATSTGTKKPSCPFNECDGSGWVDVGDGRLKRCRCMVQRDEEARIARLFQTAQIPKRFQGDGLAAWDSKRHKGAWRTACRYVEQFEKIRKEKKNGLYFVGPPGTGKSHLAYGILGALLRQGVPGVCGSVPEVLDLLRPGKEAANAEERLELLKSIDLVVLDDLGVEKSTDWALERLYMIVNARYNEVLPTIITSEFELEVLERLTGWERITSRIFEMCYLVAMDGDDFRKEVPPR